MKHKHFLILLLGLTALSACSITPRGSNGQLAPEREMMEPNRFPTDSAQDAPVGPGR